MAFCINHHKHIRNSENTSDAKYEKLVKKRSSNDSFKNGTVDLKNNMVVQEHHKEEKEANLPSSLPSILDLESAFVSQNKDISFAPLGFHDNQTNDTLVAQVHGRSINKSCLES